MEQTKLLSGKSYLWLGVFFGVMLWSGIEPKDRLTWVLEAGPAVIGLLVIAKTRTFLFLSLPCFTSGSLCIVSY